MTELTGTNKAKNIVVVGASGGIASAVLRQFVDDPSVARIFAFSRRAPTVTDDKLVFSPLDLTNESSIAKMAQMLNGAELDCVMVCSGLLHSDSVKPEKSIRQFEQASLEQLFQINAIAPMLVAKALTPLLRKKSKTVFAVISARVGSISDNQLGGWYGYRASKSALHMLMKTLSVELKRKLPEAIVLCLHPGTVDTSLSKPFQARVPEGKLFTPAQSAGYLLDVVANAKLADTGKIFAWDGTEITP